VVRVAAVDVFSDRRLTERDPKLQQLPMDARRAPQRVRHSHLTNQRTSARRQSDGRRDGDSSTSRATGSRVGATRARSPARPGRAPVATRSRRATTMPTARDPLRSGEGACDATGSRPPADVAGQESQGGGPCVSDPLTGVRRAPRRDGDHALSLIEADRNFNRRTAYEVSGRHKSHAGPGGQACGRAERPRTCINEDRKTNLDDVLRAAFLARSAR
jgi:hypothetical protein